MTGHWMIGPGGVPITVLPFTKRGDRMAFVGMEDLHGSCEVTVFPRLLESTRQELLQEGAVILVRGKVDARNERASIVADELLDTFEYAVAASEHNGLADADEAFTARTGAQ